MTSDPDEEAERRRQIRDLDQWMREQKIREIADHLGLPPPPPGESWAGSVITPQWWDQVPEPGSGCPWCQRPGIPSPCGDCRQARATAGDPPALWAWWATLTPARRRLHIAARFGTDPWTGRHVRITAEWTEVDADEQIGTTHLRYLGCTPDGIYWKTTAAY
jgi:hypothetical protein